MYTESPAAMWAGNGFGGPGEEDTILIPDRLICFSLVKPLPVELSKVFLLLDCLVWIS
jgi:hypothetical protein